MPAPGAPYSRAELESAFQDYQDAVDRIAGSGDWARFADLFTEDATYVEHAYGTFRGREEIRAWIVRTIQSRISSRPVKLPYACSRYVASSVNRSAKRDHSPDRAMSATSSW